MFVQRIDIPLATIADGSGTAFSPDVVTGRIVQLAYTPDGSTPLDTGGGLTVTSEVSGTALATLTNIGTSAFTKAIRQATHGVTGAAALYAAAGTAVNDAIWIAGERIKVVIAAGGNVKKGTLTIWTE